MTTKNIKMTAGAKLKLASIPRTRCAKCNKARTYLNPMAKCWECKKKFCYNDINCLQVNDTMNENDEVRHTCDECKEEHGYKTLE